MPEVFEENCKFRIIEYGNSESMTEIMRDVKNGLLKLIAK